jgi:hypothetical protein
MRTIAEEIKIVASIQPQTLTNNNSDTSGETVVDTMGWSDVCFAIVAGNGTFVDETYSFQVYESASNSSTVGIAAITGAVATITADNTVKKIQVSGLGTGSRLRYMFVRCSLAGSNESLPCTAIAILSGSTGALQPAQAVTASV